MGGKQQSAAFHSTLNREPQGAQGLGDHWYAQRGIDGALHPDGVDEKPVETRATFAVHAQRELCLLGEDVPHNGGHGCVHEVVENDWVRVIKNGAVVQGNLAGDVEHLSLRIDGQRSAVAAPDLCGL